MLLGSIDHCRDRVVEGWAWEPPLDRPVLLAVYAGDQFVTLEMSGNHREDLAAAGIGKGAHAFRLVIPQEVWDGGAPIHIVSILPGAALPGSPIVRDAAGCRVPSARDRHFPPDLDALKAAWNDHPDVHALDALLKSCDQRTVALRRRIHDSFVRGLATAREWGGIEALEHPDFARPGQFLGDILLFAPVDWGFRIQRYQHLAMRLADLGFRVFYVSPESINGSGRSPPFHIAATPHPDVHLTRMASTGRTTDLADGRLDDAVADSAVLSLSALMAAHRMGPPVCVSAFPTWHAIVARLPKALYVYDCADLHTGFAHVADAVGALERTVLDAADLVVVSAAGLRDLMEAQGAKAPIHVVPNAADSGLLRPGRARTREGRPTVGYLGAIEEWLDTDLVKDAARRLPGCDFVFAGSGSEAVERQLRGLPNIRLVGEVPYAEVAGTLARFDVGIIPFKRSALIRYTDPVKAYEYLAAGLPVVATDMPELAKFADAVSCASEGPAFADAIVTALGRNSPADEALRRRLAAQHSWERRALDLAVRIRDCLTHLIVVVLADDHRTLRIAARPGVAMTVTIALVVAGGPPDAAAGPDWVPPSGSFVALHARTGREVVSALEPRSNHGKAVVALCTADAFAADRDRLLADLQDRAGRWMAGPAAGRPSTIAGHPVALCSWSEFSAMAGGNDDLAGLWRSFRALRAGPARAV